MQDLTPKEIVAELDKYIIGQDGAKRAVAVALRNRYRRRLLGEDIREEVIPKNILMIGATGIGKTEIARRLAQIANAPFIKVEATKFTEVGYVGRDVDSMVRDLVQLAVRMVENEKIEDVQERAKDLAAERILNIMQPLSEEEEAPAAPKDLESAFQMVSQILGGQQTAQSPEPPPEPPKEADLEADIKRRERIREKLRKQLLDGALDDKNINIEVEESSAPFMQVFTPQGMEEMGMDMQGMLGSMMPRRKRNKSVTVKEAKEILAHEAAGELVDQDAIVKEAIERTEQSGIIFIDELDKIAGREHGGEGGGPQVSREGVQRDILPIIEGSTVVTKYGPVSTNHILFIAAGAFHVSKPSDLIPELQGRLPIRVELDNLYESDLKRILTDPKNALIKQYTALLSTEGVSISFTEDAVSQIASIAAEVNSRAENIGARRLHTVMERLLEDLSFNAPELAGSTVTIDAGYVHDKLEGIVKDEDISKYIL
ncbi:MAG: ATP-dependent protease ATPase subunit HslU [Armatimonadota bacterium]